MAYKTIRQTKLLCLSNILIKTIKIAQFEKKNILFLCDIYADDYNI